MKETWVIVLIGAAMVLVGAFRALDAEGIVQFFYAFTMLVGLVVVAVGCIECVFNPD